MIFSEESLNSLARSTGFMKRNRKLNPLRFLDLMFHSFSENRCSLRQTVLEAPVSHDISLSKQSLDKRFSSGSVMFSKQLLANVLNDSLPVKENQYNTNLFQRVLIKDSTRFEVDDSLAKQFPGYGGASSKALVSIQLEYDLKSGQITDIDLQGGLDRDSTDALTKKGNIRKGDLIIRDLGYYHGEVFRQIEKAGAFFISRLNAKAKVYLSEEASWGLDFGQLYEQMSSANQGIQEMNVYLGEHHLAVRLIMSLVPERVYQERIRKRTQELKRQPRSKSRSKNPQRKKEWDSQKTDKKYTMSQEFRNRSRFNLFISNVPKESLPTQSVCELYRTRWQIELVFKIWKSVMGINQIRKMRYERLVTTLYLQLLWVVLNWEIASTFRIHFYHQDHKLLSYFKCMNTLHSYNRMVRGLLKLSYRKVRKTLRKFHFIFIHNHWIERRKNKVSYIDLHPVLFCRLDNYDYIYTVKQNSSLA